MFLQSINETTFNTLSSRQKSILKDHGVMTVGQLMDQLKKRPEHLKTLGIDTKAIQLECTALFKSQGVDPTAVMLTAPVFIPPLGLMLDPKESPEIMYRRTSTQKKRSDLVSAAVTLQEELPDEFILVDKMQPVRNQKHLGSCTGFGSTNAREYLEQSALSPGFSYRLAKLLDGHEGEGSWMEFAFDGMVRYGSVTEEEYSYDMCIDNTCIKPYLDSATNLKISAYADLMVEPEHLPTILKASLSGMLVPELGPQPVAISVAVYESFSDYSAYKYGLIPVPLEGEMRDGGHAMCCVGYTTLYDTNYFIVIN